MFIGPRIIAIVDEWKTSLMSLAILFHLLCAQHVSDINISIFRSLWLCWWITTSVVLFSVRCVLELFLRLVFGGVGFAGWNYPQTSRNSLGSIPIESNTLHNAHPPLCQSTFQKRRCFKGENKGKWNICGFNHEHVQQCWTEHLATNNNITIFFRCPL